MIGRTHGIHAEPMSFGLKPEIPEMSRPSEIEDCFDLEEALSRMDGIYRLIFREEGGKPEQAG